MRRTLRAVLTSVSVPVPVPVPALALALALALCATACTDDEREPTEVILVIDADAEVAEQSSRLRLRIESLADDDDSSEPEEPRDVEWPFKLALTPRGGDATRGYRVTAEAVDADDDRIAAARIVSGFVAGERRRVRMVIESACIDQPLCRDPDETCHLPRGAARGDDGVCVSARVDPKRLGHDDTPDLGDLLDAPPRMDAGSGEDGGDDAGVDGAVDDAGTDAGPPPLDPCGSSHGGCDPLSVCTVTADGVDCGACLPGFAGNGDDGCTPLLLDLSVAPGDLTPVFDAETMQYRVDLELSAERIAVTASAPAGASLAIADEAVRSGRAWTLDPLPAGENALAIELGVESGLGTSYALTVTRGAQHAYFKASNAGAGDHFGAAVAISGDTIVIGAGDEDGAADGQMDSGAAYVLVRDGAGWVEQAVLRAGNAGNLDNFGHAVAISGDTIVVGAPLEDSSARGVDVPGGGALNDAQDSGAAYVFVRDGAGAWSQQAYLKADNAELIDWFGGSVAIGGDTIAVGAFLESGNATTINGERNNNAAPSSGAVYVFVRTGAQWSQQAYLKPLNNGNEHLFGGSVAVAPDGATVAAGAIGDNDDDAHGRGSAYVFTRAGAIWSQAAHLKSGMSSPGEAFGYSVAMSQDTLAVGTSSNVAADALQGGAAGAVHVFEREDGFTASRRLVAPNRDPNDNFGSSVAIDGDGNLLLVGAPNEAGTALGIHPSAAASDNGAIASGAAYVFARGSAGWTLLAYLKASNAESSDRFGIAVAAAAGNLVVGAIYENGGGTGVSAAPGPDDADTAADASGAAYVFR